MARKKLKKRASAGVIHRSKKIDVVDKEGNKHILKCTVIGVDQKEIKKESSHALLFDDGAANISLSNKILAPPLSQTELAVLREFSSELGPNLDAMATGVEGFGARLVLKDMDDAQKRFFESEINQEKRWLKVNVLDLPNSEMDLTQLRKALNHDKEATGNSWLELVPTLDGGKYACYNKLDAGTMFICKADRKLTRIKQKYVDENFNIKEKSFLKRLRRYVQIVGNKKVFFKEFRDPRIIDKRTGEVATEVLPAKFRAREVIHDKIITNSRRGPYGMPRFTGNIIAIKGSRTADEANILTQQNNNVPSMAILVSGGALTDGSIERVQEFVDTAIKGDLNYSKFLILEGEQIHDALSGPSNTKIEIKPLTSNQHTDAVWKEYDERNEKKIRKNFRQAPLLVGDLEGVDRASAQESERLTEKYVYNPEREAADKLWNRILAQQGIRFYDIKTNSPNVTNDEDIVKLLSNAEKSGGITPRIARMMLEDVVNRDLPPVPEKKGWWDPDLPFSFLLARMVQGMGMANRAGTAGPQGQMRGPDGRNGRPPKEDGAGDEEETAGEDKSLEILQDIIDPQQIIAQRLFEQSPDQILQFIQGLTDQVEESLDKEGFGFHYTGYFNHEH